ncbi:hypothetical protein ABT039_22835 [Streptomyces lasiicapitis]|uniref:hypothetical protein n=1 Tax=Streptomyces lasiicapitis TaxID=1923961 RepID=UPI0033223CAF
MTDTPTAAGNDIEAATTTLAPLPPPTAPTTTAVQEAGAADWPEHLSPLAVFQPGRVVICAAYQVSAVDAAPATAHLQAALRHVRSAADEVVTDDHTRTVAELRAIKAELHRIAQQIGFRHSL